MLQSNLANATTSFQEILEVRTQNMKASRDRSEQFFRGPTPGPLERQNPSPLYALARSAGPSRASTPASLLHNRSAVAGKADAELGTGPTNSDGFLALDMMSGGMQQQQLLTEEESQSSYMQQRSMAIESIESTISELGQIFGQLAHMVSQQGETVQRIDDDVVHVVDHVEGAQRELLKYYATITNNRWLMLKIFGVLIVFFLRTLIPLLTDQCLSSFRRGLYTRPMTALSLNEWGTLCKTHTLGFILSSHGHPCACASATGDRHVSI